MQELRRWQGESFGTPAVLDPIIWTPFTDSITRGYFFFKSGGLASTWYILVQGALSRHEGDAYCIVRGHLF